MDSDGYQVVVGSALIVSCLAANLPPLVHSPLFSFKEASPPPCSNRVAW